MFRFLRSKSSKQTSATTLYFKSGEEFLEYQCKFGFTSIEKGTGLIAIVVDAQKQFGAPVPIRLNKDGSQTAYLAVASDPDLFSTFASTPSAQGERLQPGDVVLWVPSVYSEELSLKFPDTRKGWVGMIKAKVKPEINPADPSFVIQCRYD